MVATARQQRGYSEGGRGWAMVAAAFVTQFILYGNLKAGGVLITDMARDFETDLWVIGLINSLYYGTQYALSPVPVAISKYLPARYIVVFGGVMNGLGFVWASKCNSIPVLSLAMVIAAGGGSACVKEITFAQMSLYFHNRYALASFIAKLGAPFGMMIYGPVTQLLVDHYGWRGAMLVLGGLALNLTVCGVLIRPPLRAPREYPYEALDSWDGPVHESCSCCSKLIMTMGMEVFKDPRFMFLTAIKLFSEFSYAGIVIYMVPNALSVGLSAHQSSFTTTAWGVGNLLGLALTAAALHYRVLSDWAVMALGASLSAVCYAVDPIVGSFAGQIAITLAVGTAVETVFLVPVIVTRYLARDDQVVFLYSWQNFISGLSYPAAGLVSGVLYQASGNFIATFLTLSGAMVFASVFVAMYAVYSRLSRN